MHTDSHPGSGFGFSFGYPAFHFRDPEEVFREFFGGRDPFAEFFSGMVGEITQDFLPGVTWIDPNFLYNFESF